MQALNFLQCKPGGERGRKSKNEEGGFGQSMAVALGYGRPPRETEYDNAPLSMPLQMFGLPKRMVRLYKDAEVEKGKAEGYTFTDMPGAEGKINFQRTDVQIIGKLEGASVGIYEGELEPTYYYLLLGNTTTTSSSTKPSTTTTTGG